MLFRSLETVLIERYTESQSFLEGDASSAIYDVSNTVDGNNGTIGNGYYYYYSDGNKVITNLKSADELFFDKYDGELFILKDSRWRYNNNENYPYYSIYLDDNAEGYIAFTPEYLKSAQESWDIQRAKTVPLAWMFAGITIGTLLLLIYLTVTAGRTQKNGPLILNPIDNIPSDRSEERRVG